MILSEAKKIILFVLPKTMLLKTVTLSINYIVITLLSNTLRYLEIHIAVFSVS